jgi:hypothetical protein
MERLSDGKRQKKLAKAFKAVISAGLVAPVFVSAAACGKEQPAVVEKAQADEQATAIIETTPETKETQPLVKEETPPSTEVEEAKPVEWEGIMINPIEGLRFDNGSFFVLENNPYGLEAETKAGVFIKDAFEFNGEMENSIGLRPEVIEVLQQKYLEENKELKIPVFINLEESKDVKINLLTNEASNEDLKKVSPKDSTALVMNAPAGTIIYSPLKTNYREEFSGIAIIDWKDEKYPNHYDVNIIIPEEVRSKIIYENFEGMAWGLFLMTMKNSEVLVSDEIKDKHGYIRSSSEIGMPLFRVIKGLENNDLQVDENNKTNQIYPDQYPIDFYLFFENFTYNEDTGKNELSFLLKTGEDIFLEMNNTNIFILPANDK